MKNMLCALALSVCAAVAKSAEYVPARYIVDLGCHNTNGTCYVTLDGSGFGSSLGCALGVTTQFRFDDADTAIGRRSWASMLFAFSMKKHVGVSVNGCTAQGYPKLDFFVISD